MTGCTALRLFSQGDPGVVHLLSIPTRVIRPLNVMVTSACDGRYCPDRRHDVADRWLRAPEARASLRADVFPSPVCQAELRHPQQ